MTVNQRSKDNLVEGGLTDEARQNGIRNAAEAKKAKSRTKAELERLAGAGDTGAALELIFPTLIVHINDLLQKEKNEKAKPSRELTDRIKEARQFMKDLNDFRASRDANDQAADFFERLDDRLGGMNLREESPERPSE